MVLKKVFKLNNKKKTIAHLQISHCQLCMSSVLHVVVVVGSGGVVVGGSDVMVDDVMVEKVHRDEW